MSTVCLLRAVLPSPAASLEGELPAVRKRESYCTCAMDVNYIE
jgi:hypothetical protein